MYAHTKSDPVGVASVAFIEAAAVADTEAATEKTASVAAGAAPPIAASVTEAGATPTELLDDAMLLRTDDVVPAVSTCCELVLTANR